MLSLLSACGEEAPLPRQIPLLQAEVRCGGAVLQAEVAADPEARERGLMFRRELPEDTGMLFVMPELSYGAFWMRDTFVPLSIAFLDAGGMILDISDMEAFDETAVGPDEPFLYALEVPQGWFALRGVYPGDSCAISLPPGLTPG